MSKKWIFSIAVPAIVAFVAGAWFASSGVEAQQRMLESARLDQAKSLAQSVSLAIRAKLDQGFERAGLSRSQIAAGFSPGPFDADPLLLHWVSFKGAAIAAQASYLLSEGTRTMLSTSSGRPWEQEYLDQVSSIVRTPSSRRQQLLRIKPDSMRAQEWIAVIRRELFRDGVTATAILIDPARLAVDAFANVSASPGLRVYWIADKDGTVLAHSQPSYIGSLFSKSEAYSLASTQSGSEHAPAQLQPTDRAAIAPAIDRIRVALALVPISIGGEETGFSIGVERVVSSSPSPLLFADLLRALLIALLAIAAGAAVVILKPRRSPNEDSQVPTGETPGLFSPPSRDLPNPPSRASAAATATVEVIRVEADATPEQVAQFTQLSTTQAARAAGRQDLDAARENLKTARDEQRFVADFEKEAARLRDPKSVATRLTEVSAKLCSSQALFFAFHEGVGAAILLADAGFAPGEAPLGMSFPVDAEAVKKIQALEASGQVASLAQYEPLARIILSRLGQAHFEAWAVTGYSHLGRQAGRAKLLGALVILQSGYETVTRQESLSRMMRSTGLIYENALLSQ